MDRLRSLELFSRIVEGGSFSRAASDLRIARSSATNAIRELERETGVRLLARTTRQVTPTPEGMEFYHRARAILSEIDDTFGHFAAATPGGHLRIEAPGLLTRTFLVPRLPGFLERYPGLSISFLQSDRLVDIIREGVDCAIRAGTPEDSSLHMRPLGALPEITCASPGYLARHGTPRSLAELEGHRMIGFISSRTGKELPLEFCHEGGIVTRSLPVTVATDNSDTAAALAVQGLGLIQAPRYRFAADLASGALVEVLPDTPPGPLPFNALHAGERVLSRRLEVFLDWLKEVFVEIR